VSLRGEELGDPATGLAGAADDEIQVVVHVHKYMCLRQDGP
jgi:hypothetical protein